MCMIAMITVVGFGFGGTSCECLDRRSANGEQMGEPSVSELPDGMTSFCHVTLRVSGALSTKTERAAASFRFGMEN